MIVRKRLNVNMLRNIKILYWKFLSVFVCVQGFNNTTFESDYIIKDYLDFDRFDSRINLGIVEPMPGKGDDTFQDLFIMLNNLYNWYQVLNAEDPANVTNTEVIHLTKQVRTAGGPLTIIAPIDEENVMTKYGWDKQFMDVFYQTIRTCEKIWKYIELILKNKDL